MRVVAILGVLVSWPVGCSALAGLDEYRPASAVGGGGAGGTGGSGGGGDISPWLGQFARRRALVLDTEVADTDLMGFTTPVVIGADAELAELTQGDGRDIAFTQSDGETPLSHELEHFDATTGAVAAWVHLPLVKAFEPTTIYVYFGDPDAADQQDVAGTWPAETYRGVWHLSDDPSDAPPQIEDSSSHGQDGVVSGTPTAVEGIVASALRFDVDGAHVAMADADQLDVASTGFSVSLWVHVSASTTSGDRPLQKIGGDPSRGYIMLLGSGAWGAELRVGTATVPVGLGQEAAHVDDWTQLAMVVDPSTGFLVGYVNGTVSDSSPLMGLDLTQAINAEALYLSGPGGPFNGAVDELRLHSGALTDAWMALDYHASTSPDFVQAGEVEVGPP